MRMVGYSGVGTLSWQLHEIANDYEFGRKHAGGDEPWRSQWER